MRESNVRPCSEALKGEISSVSQSVSLSVLGGRRLRGNSHEAGQSKSLTDTDTKICPRLVVTTSQISLYPLTVSSLQIRSEQCQDLLPAPPLWELDLPVPVEEPGLEGEVEAESDRGRPGEEEEVGRPPRL